MRSALGSGPKRRERTDREWFTLGFPDAGEVQSSSVPMTLDSEAEVDGALQQVNL